MKQHRQDLEKLKVLIGKYAIILGHVSRKDFNPYKMNRAHLLGNASIILPLEESTNRALAIAMTIFQKAELVNNGIYVES